MYFFSTVCRYQFVPRPSNAFAFKLHTSSAHTSPTGQWSRQIDKETHKKLYCRFVNEINAPVSNVCSFTQHSKLILLFFLLAFYSFYIFLLRVFLFTVFASRVLHHQHPLHAFSLCHLSQCVDFSFFSLEAFALLFPAVILGPFNVLPISNILTMLLHSLFILFFAHCTLRSLPHNHVSYNFAISLPKSAFCAIPAENVELCVRNVYSSDRLDYYTVYV